MVSLLKVINAIFQVIFHPSAKKISYIIPNFFAMNNENLEELKCFLSEKIDSILSERLLDISGIC